MQVKTPIYNIPFRSLYSKNVDNLMHRRPHDQRHAHGVHQHARHGDLRRRGPGDRHRRRALREARAACREPSTRTKTSSPNCRQILLRDDQSIADRKNDDPPTWRATAKVTASGETEDGKAANVVNGFDRDIPGEYVNRWSTELTGDGAWLELTWPKPQKIAEVQLMFDSGFQRELTLTSSDGSNKAMIRAPQPETVRDYELVAIDADGKETSSPR